MTHLTQFDRSIMTIKAISSLSLSLSLFHFLITKLRLVVSLARKNLLRLVFDTREKERGHLSSHVNIGLCKPNLQAFKAHSYSQKYGPIPSERSVHTLAWHDGTTGKGNIIAIGFKLVHHIQQQIIAIRNKQMRRKNIRWPLVRDNSYGPRPSK